MMMMVMMVIVGRQDDNEEEVNIFDEQDNRIKYEMQDWMMSEKLQKSKPDKYEVAFFCADGNQHLYNLNSRCTQRPSSAPTSSNCILLIHRLVIILQLTIMIIIAQGMHSQPDRAKAGDVRDGDHSSSSPHGVRDCPHPVHHHQLVGFFEITDLVTINFISGRSHISTPPTGTKESR